MWEVIAANKRKSVVLLAVMAMIMIAAGMLIAEAIAPGAWPIGGVFALLLWTILSLISYYSGDAIFLASAGARKIQRGDHPMLFNIVEEMKIAAGLSAMPRIYIIDDPRPNAFAIGRNPEHASVAVTAGLLNRLSRDEVQGVVAHELGHIQNRDVLYVMLAAMMIGVIVLMSDIFLRSLWFGGGRSRSRGRGSGGGQAQIIILLAVIILAILGPLAAQMLYFALSRRREYLADACSAAYTRYPEGLASALEKIASNPGLAEKKNRALAPMYIVNPLQAAKSAVGLFSTHPATQDRVRLLRSMAGASLADYEQAYKKAKGGRMVPASALKTARPVGVRPASQEEPSQPQPTPQERARQTSDLLWKLNKYIFLPCVCGAQLKIPPGFKSAKVRCPRCNRMHDIPPSNKAKESDPNPTPKGRPET